MTLNHPPDIQSNRSKLFGKLYREYLTDSVFLITALYSKALATSMASTGLVWRTSTGWQTREITNCWSRWRTGQAERCLQSMPASGWSQRLISTSWGWAATMATLETPSPGTTANSSQHWTETTMHIQVQIIMLERVKPGAMQQHCESLSEVKYSGV